MLPLQTVFIHMYYTHHQAIFGAGGCGCLLHLGGILDGPGRHVELVGEDGEQRQDVLVEERLLLLLLLRRRRRRSGRRTQATEARYCLVELQRKMSCNLQCISLVRYSRDRRNTLQRFPTSKHILRSKRMISALKMSFSDKRWLLINNFTFYPVKT